MAQYLSAFPIATTVSALFYVLLLVLCIPKFRAYLFPELTPRPSNANNHIPALDTIRGFAALLVTVGHCWYWTWPVFAKTQFTFQFIAYDSKAVPIFCVLSGFLIYRSVLGAVRSTSDLRKYAIRRFFRIYPVYLLGIVLCWVFGQYANYLPGVSGFSTFVSDIFMLHIFGFPNIGNPVTWSLCIEMMFYVSLPIIVLVVGRERIVVLAGLALIGMIFADFGSRDYALWRYFIIGVIASELSPHIKRASLPLLALGIAMFIYDFEGPTADWVANLGLGVPHPDNETWGLGIACGLVVASLPHLPLIGAALSVWPLRLIGTVSYSLYIIHPFYLLTLFPQIGLLGQYPSIGEAKHDQFRALFPVMPDWYLFVLFVPGVLLLAVFSYMLIERPGMRLGAWIASSRGATNILSSLPSELAAVSVAKADR